MMTVQEMHLMYLQKMHNITVLESIHHELCSTQASEDLPRNVTSSKIELVLNQNQSETGGLTWMIGFLMGN